MLRTWIYFLFFHLKRNCNEERILEIKILGMCWFLTLFLRTNDSTNCLNAISFKISQRNILWLIEIIVRAEYNCSNNVLYLMYLLHYHLTILSKDFISTFLRKIIKCRVQYLTTIVLLLASFVYRFQYFH